MGDSIMTVIIRWLIAAGIFFGISVIGWLVGIGLPLFHVAPEDVSDGDGIGVLLFGGFGLLAGVLIGLVLAGSYWRRSYRRGKI